MNNKYYNTTRFVCVHGGVGNSTNAAKCSSDSHLFMMVTNPTQVTTDREHIIDFPSLEAMQNAFPGWEIEL